MADVSAGQSSVLRKEICVRVFGLDGRTSRFWRGERAIRDGMKYVGCKGRWRAIDFSKYLNTYPASFRSFHKNTVTRKMHGYR